MQFHARIDVILVGFFYKSSGFMCFMLHKTGVAWMGINEFPNAES